MTQTAQPPVLLTSVQVGALLGKSQRTVQRLAESGVLSYAQKIPGPNGAYLFREADVRAFRDAEARFPDEASA